MDLVIQGQFRFSWYILYLYLTLLYTRTSLFTLHESIKEESCAKHNTKSLILHFMKIFFLIMPALINIIPVFLIVLSRLRPNLIKTRSLIRSDNFNFLWTSFFNVLSNNHFFLIKINVVLCAIFFFLSIFKM